MSQEFVERLFIPFERERTSTVSKIQGTGLGLAITKSIVDMMGGNISVLTEKGKGTEFTITVDFPLAEPGYYDVILMDIKKAEEIGMNGHIAKPLDIPSMKATLQDVLKKK